jgi:alcohol dehydrogenase
MRAAVLHDYGDPLVIEDVPAPDPDPDGAVVRVDACGICRSDWHAWQGHGEWADDRVSPGQILGHEPAGEVLAVGEQVETLSEGDRVAVPFNLGDGTCPQCRTGHGNVCSDGLALGFEQAAQGAFAEQVHLPSADYNAIRLPDGVSAREVAALGCRFMTAFHALSARADLGPGDWLAVHGCGGVGLSAVQVGDALGARVVAVDIADEKLTRARDLGAEVTVDASAVGEDATPGDPETGVPAAVRDATDGGAHVSVDALGVAETCRNSVACLRRRGQHLQLGLTTDDERGEVALPVDRVAMQSLDVLGSRGMPPTRADDLIRFVGRSDVDPGALVSREVALSDVSDRLAAMTDYETEGVEVVTDFSG